MANLKELKEIIEESRSLKLVTESYTDIASSKLKKIRNGIEHNRVFLSEIAGIYYTIKLVKKERQLNLPSGSSILDKLSQFSRVRFRLPEKKVQAIADKTGKKTISILLTSNHRFHGSIERQLTDFFVSNSGKFNTDRIAIGKTGIRMIEEKRIAGIEKITFAGDLPKAKELQTLLAKTKPYQQILVYHQRFQSVLAQQPFIRDIRETQIETSIPKKRIDYIIEPEIDKMLAFFDAQISLLLLEQTFLEADLARTAARLVAMDHAQENANMLLDEYAKLLSQTRGSLYNLQFLETVNNSFGKRGIQE
jgi:F-type H+-transporting ATPase subunit gamma